MNKTKNRIIGLELLFNIVTLAIFLILDAPPLADTQLGNLIGILNFVMFLVFWSCLKLERYRGNYECAFCGQIHPLTDGQKLLSLGDENAVHVCCAKCHRQTWHYQV